MSYLLRQEHQYSQQPQQHHQQLLKPLSSSSSSDPTPATVHLPEVGQTRCYWALLNDQLQFLLLDPVFSYHLHNQAPLLIGKSLLDFVHPEELDSARHDLGNVVNDKTLHGSVTRVRYCRLSRVRSILGFTPTPSSPPYPPSFPAERISIDENYMAVDIVINWAADGLVLCFIHAVVDLLPVEDNDENIRTGWSNWCRTVGFDEETAQSFYHSLCHNLHPAARPCADDSLRVFQILRDEPLNSVLLTWPYEASRSQFAPSSADLARLAQDVRIGSPGIADHNARTSCTRRFRSQQSIPVDGRTAAQVESIFIPHGSVVFACHKINQIYSPPNDAPPQENLYYEGSCHLPSQGYYDPEDAYSLSYVHSAPTAPTQYAQQWVEGQQENFNPWPHSQSPSPTISSGAHSRSGSNTTNPAVYHQWSASSTLPYAPNPNYPHPQSQIQSPPRPPSTFDHPSTAPTPNPVSESTERDLGEGSPISHTSESSTTLGKQIEKRDTPSSSTTGAARESYTTGGRSAGHPPVGVLRCSSCKVTQSPEWRKGPSGKKDLCNACGLRYARSRAKKDGVTPRRRKERNATSSTRHMSATSSVVDEMDGESSSAPSLVQPKHGQQALDEAQKHGHTREIRATPPPTSYANGHTTLDYVNTDSYPSNSVFSDVPSQAASRLHGYVAHGTSSIASRASNLVERDRERDRERSREKHKEYDRDYDKDRLHPSLNAYSDSRLIHGKVPLLPSDETRRTKQKIGYA